METDGIQNRTTEFYLKFSNTQDQENQVFLQFSLLSDGVKPRNICTCRYRLCQRFSNFFQVGTIFISQNVLRTILLLGLSNSLGLP